MRCSGCQKDVPFFGEFCRYCDQAKRDDQESEIKLGICVAAAAIGGITAFLWGFREMKLLAGVVTGACVGLVIARAIFKAPHRG